MDRCCPHCSDKAKGKAATCDRKFHMYLLVIATRIRDASRKQLLARHATNGLLWLTGALPVTVALPADVGFTIFAIFLCLPSVFLRPREEHSQGGMRGFVGHSILHHVATVSTDRDIGRLHQVDAFHSCFSREFRELTDGMKLYIDSTLMHRTFEQSFGGIANFVDEWATTSGPHGGDDKQQRGVSTIYAWLKNGLPSRSETVFRFFGALGIDPIAVIDLDRSKLPQNFGRLRAAFMLGGATAGGFGPLFELYRPSASWPDVQLVTAILQLSMVGFRFRA